MTALVIVDEVLWIRRSAQPSYFCHRHVVLPILFRSLDFGQGGESSTGGVERIVMLHFSGDYVVGWLFIHKTYYNYLHRKLNAQSTSLFSPNNEATIWLLCLLRLLNIKHKNRCYDAHLRMQSLYLVGQDIWL